MHKTLFDFQNNLQDFRILHISVDKVFIKDHNFKPRGDLANFIIWIALVQNVLMVRKRKHLELFVCHMSSIKIHRRYYSTV